MEGGYWVSGRGPFASGSSHASHVTGEALIYDDGGAKPRKDESGNDVVLVFFVPRADVTVFDNWDTTGLRGTASNNLAIEEAFVPQRQVFDFAEPQHEWPLFRCGGLIYMNHGAQAAVAGAREVFTSKRGWGGVPLQEVGRAQETFAMAQARFESAEGYYYRTAELLWNDVQRSGGEGDVTLRTKVRLAASHAMTESLAVVDVLHRACATSAIARSHGGQNPLDRVFRDIHTAAAHVMVGPLVYEAAGRVLLERDADFPLF